jgi:hypothetical protein
MELEITPEPSDVEREAIEAALRRLLAGTTLPAAYSSAWRQAGLREAVQADARPRSNRGATRA